MEEFGSVRRKKLVVGNRVGRLEGSDVGIFEGEFVGNKEDS